MEADDYNLKWNNFEAGITRKKQIKDLLANLNICEPKMLLLILFFRKKIY